MRAYADSAPFERPVGRLVQKREDTNMKIKTRLFSAYVVGGAGWFRLFGRGIGWKDTRRFRLTFSERNGYKKHMMLGPWSFAMLWAR